MNWYWIWNMANSPSLPNYHDYPAESDQRHNRGIDILVTFGPPSELDMMFGRNLDGRSLTFKPITKVQNGTTLMKDQETGTIWEVLTGRAISGPLCGGELKPLNSEYSFWFAWSQLDRALKSIRRDQKLY